MNILNNLLLEMHEYKGILRDLESRTSVNITGPSDSQKVHLACSLLNHLRGKGIYITFNDMQARRVYEDTAFFLGVENVLYFSPREILLHDIEARSNETIYERINALGRILDGNFRIIVTSIEAMAIKLTSPNVFENHILTFDQNSIVDLAILQSQLISMGFERVIEVEGKGQFSVRGGIIDIFPVNLSNPIRIELFGDEIDSIRSFNPDTKRSIEPIESASVLPARDIIYDEKDIEDIIDNIKKDLKDYNATLKKGQSSVLKDINERVNLDIDRMRNNHHFPGIDRYIPYMIESPASIIDYIKEDIVIFIDEPARQRQRIDNLQLEHYENCKELMERGHLLPGSIESQYDYDTLESIFDKKCVVALNVLSIEQKAYDAKKYSISAKTLGSYEGHFNLLTDDVKIWKSSGKHIVILTGTKVRAHRFVDNLTSNGVEAIYIENDEYSLKPGQVIVTEGSIHRGFEYTSIGLVVISDNLIGRSSKKSGKIKSTKNMTKIDVFTELSLGDYVVHQTHGIGKYVGLENLEVENVKRDYIKIRYLGEDYLYIPTEQMNLIQKYVGAEGKAPKINKLGGSDWVRTKKKVKESLMELAEELIRLYAKRQAVKGYAFSEDTVWQKQFEEMFPYEETEDQLRCIEELKRDMETEKPVDRLLCGDVGYGKTEVAIRAVFKAVMDGKQVAYLCPTTVLAQQHYNTFKNRMEEFPVTVEVISRFKTKAEQQKIVKEVKNGNVDVLIGTHRILQKDVKFRDLALLVVDEEQRFGVEHKERIKNLSPNIDVLTLTATPIPRTLHMSLIGIRDISVLEHPPEERYPIQTYVMEYDEEFVRDAILREMARKGQVFYLFNRVRSIDLKAAKIAKLVPDARVATAHGQMYEGQLEKIMVDFIDGKYDVLVCTTIIESGLDMPNVNTIIVEDADRMGLAQLYQIRGRVGRSNRLAYAYVTYKKDKVLTEVAEKRLKAIREFTEFGSGFKIAMRDLEIRGAGNLLGPQQHGHIASVGYDMYCKLLEQAVQELQGVKKKEKQEDISIDLFVNAYIGDEYITSEVQRIEMYKKVASIGDNDDVIEIRDEFIDRFGDIPYTVDNLIKIADIKAIAGNVGLSSISEKDNGVIFQFREIPNWLFGAIGSIVNKYKRQILFNASKNPYLLFKTDNIKREDLLDSIKILLQDIKSFEVA